MEKQTNIYTKLQEARVELQNKNLKKSGHNKFAGFKYYELSDFLPDVNSIFQKLGISSCFNLNETEATLAIINTDNPADVLTFHTTLPLHYEVKGSNPIQLLGGTHTYLKRYLYLNALEIVENDLIDASNETDQPDPLKNQEYDDEIPEFASHSESETVKVEPPSKEKPVVKTARSPMSLEQTKSYLLKFLAQGQTDSKKAWGWAKNIRENPNFTQEEKLQFLDSIDYVYQSKYKEEFESSFLA